MEQKDEILNRIVSLIVTTVNPDQIMLFGSYARGDYSEKSDIDMLIIKKNLSKPREITQKLYRVFYDNKIEKPVDVLAIDYDRYNELVDDIGYIYNTIRDEGRLIYGEL